MDKISVLNDSRMARISFDFIRPLIEKHRQLYLSRILAETKAGPVDVQVYAKHLGSIAALDELEASFKKEILKGEKIERELLDANAIRND